MEIDVSIISTVAEIQVLIKSVNRETTHCSGAISTCAGEQKRHLRLRNTIVIIFFSLSIADVAFYICW